MADSKISDLSVLAEQPNDSDLLHVVDVSDTTMAASGTNKKITVANALSGKQDAISGLTASGAELNILDGATLTTTELNYVDGVTSAIQTQLDGKVDENSAITGATKTKITYDAKGLVTAGADANLDDLGDVAITTPSSGQVLKYNGSAWINDTDSTGAGGSTTLGDNTDVTITTVADNEVLAYDNATSEWINQTPSEAGLATAAQGALADSAVQDLADLSITASAAELNTLDGITATTTELNYVDGVTSAIQTQIDGKSATGHTHTAANVTDFDTEVSNNTDVAANTADRHDSHVVGTKTIDETDIANGKVITYNSTSGNLEYETPSAGGGSVATDTIFDAKGDLAVGTGADTASRLAAGTDGHVLTLDSAETTGLKWAASSGGMTNPMTTQGDIITGGSSGAAGRLGIGTAGQVLTVNAGATAPEWADAAAGGGAEDPQSYTSMNVDYTAITGANGGFVTAIGTASVSSGGGLSIQHSATDDRAYANPSYVSLSGLFDKSLTCKATVGRLATPGTNALYFIRFGSTSITTATFVGTQLSFYCNQTTALNAHNANGSSETKTDVSASITTGSTTLQGLTIVFTPATNVKFYNGTTLLATHTTNLPSGAASLNSVVLSQTKSNSNQQCIFVNSSMKVYF